jgi:hypothetical protein
MVTLYSEELLVLDLSGMGLKEIDLDILVCTNLESLILDDNPDLFTLPEELEFLPKLKSLSIKGCQPGLLEQLVCLPGLENLDASRMDLKDVYRKESKLLPLGRYSHLKTLVLDHAGITSLPPALESLTNLEVLSIRHNALAALPDFILVLPALTT